MVPSLPFLAQLVLCIIQLRTLKSLTLTQAHINLGNSHLCLSFSQFMHLFAFFYCEFTKLCGRGKSKACMHFPALNIAQKVILQCLEPPPHERTPSARSPLEAVTLHAVYLMAFSVLLLLAGSAMTMFSLILRDFLDHCM